MPFSKSNSNACLSPYAMSILCLSPEEVSESVAAMYVAFWSIGEYLGPTLGGVMDENLPKTRAIVCRGPADVGCETAFPWATACFGFLLLASWLVFMLLARQTPQKPPLQG